MENNYYDVTTGKQVELSPLQKMYLELEKIITPRLLDDFCGYNEETQGFDIVLATKEIIEAKEQECEELKKGVIKQCPNCGEQYLNQIGAELFEENTRLKEIINEIKEYCELDNLYHGELPFNTHFDDILNIINKAKEK